MNNEELKVNAYSFLKVGISESNQPQIILEGTYLIDNTDLNLLPSNDLIARLYDDKIVIEGLPKGLEKECFRIK